MKILVYNRKVMILYQNEVMEANNNFVFTAVVISLNVPLYFIYKL